MNFALDATLPPLCGDTPRTGCATAADGKGSLGFSYGKAKDKLRWKLSAGDAADVSEFPDPLLTTSKYAFCLYDNSASSQPLLNATIESGELWTAKGSKLLCKNKTGNEANVTLLKIRAGDEGKTSIRLKAAREGVFTPAPPLTIPVIAQLVASDGVSPLCWRVEYTTPKKNDEAKFESKGP
jgi:hypothetical protein